MKEVLKIDNLYPLESWYFYDISKQGEALRKQWYNEFSDSQTLTLPDLNQKMIEKIFVEKFKWLEVLENIDLTARSGPHLVMFQQKDNNKKVLGIMRLTKLSNLYDGSQANYRLYMEDRFVEELFNKGQIYAFNSDGLTENFVRFLQDTVTKDTISKIHLFAKKNLAAKTADFIIKEINAGSMDQVIITDKKFAIAFINQTAMIFIKLSLSFGCAIMEYNIMSKGVLALNRLQYKKNKGNISFIISENSKFLNRNTGRTHKTSFYLIKSYKTRDISNFLLKRL